MPTPRSLSRRHPGSTRAGRPAGPADRECGNALALRVDSHGRGEGFESPARGIFPWEGGIGRVGADGVGYTVRPYRPSNCRHRHRGAEDCENSARRGQKRNQDMGGEWWAGGMSQTPGGGLVTKDGARVATTRSRTSRWDRYTRPLNRLISLLARAESVAAIQPFI